MLASRADIKLIIARATAKLEKCIVRVVVGLSLEELYNKVIGIVTYMIIDINSRMSVVYIV